MNARGRLELTGALHWSTQTCLILGGDTEDSLKRTWLNEILDVSPKMNNNNMSFKKSLFYNTQKSRQRNIFNPKSRADDDKCSMVSVSVSSLQVAVIIHNNYCIMGILRCGMEREQVESISMYRRMPQSNIAHVTNINGQNVL